MASTLEDTLFSPPVIILGVFGYNNKLSEKDLHDLLLLVLQECAHVPTRILLPSEGNTSIYLQEWAESLHIKTQVFHSDWARNGKHAQWIREDRMQKECTHALVFLSKRSNRLEKYAEQLTKKGKIVFTSPCDPPHHPLLQRPQIPPSASVSGCKSDKGTMHSFLQFRTKEEC